jgi:ribose 5-phosphate isomerase A
MSELKRKAAKEALKYIEEDSIVGVGTGSTVNFFIKELASMKHKIEGCVASSKATHALLRAEGIPVLDLNGVDDVPIYIDGADEVTQTGIMIKGGGGAHTCEKILANVARQFVCIVDSSKYVHRIGGFPIAVEVIPMARSFVARQLVLLGCDPQYREGFVTDSGHLILDVFNLDLLSPLISEMSINEIPGVVDNGIFAHRPADVVVVAYPDEIKNIQTQQVRT